MLSKLENSMNKDDVKKQKEKAIASYRDLVVFNKLYSLIVVVPCCEQVKSTMTF